MSSRRSPEPEVLQRLAAVVTGRAATSSADGGRTDVAVGRADASDAAPVHEGTTSAIAPARRLSPELRVVAGLALVAVVAAGVAGWLFVRGRPAPVPVTTAVVTDRPSAGAALASPSDAAPSAPTVIVVAVTGLVRRPGVVELPAGARVADAIDAAGGLLPDTDIGLLNLAARLEDGQQVLVAVDLPPGPASGGGGDAPRAGPTSGVVGGPAAGGGTRGGGDPAGAPAPVSLNTATAEELEQLPGVGPVTAQRIVEHRDQHGAFTSVDELQDVPGIGPAKFAQLRDRVTV